MTQHSRTLTTPPAATAAASDEVLTLDQAARLACVNQRSLDRLIAAGEGPPVLHLTKRRRGILAADLRQWLQSRRRLPPGYRAA